MRSTQYLKTLFRTIQNAHYVTTLFVQHQHLFADDFGHIALDPLLILESTGIQALCAAINPQNSLPLTQTNHQSTTDC